MIEFLSVMDSCNGEIRIQPIRYSIKGCGFMCVASAVEQDDCFWDLFEDMVGGDLDYFDAEGFFMDKRNKSRMNFGFAYADTPENAMRSAVSDAEKAMETSQ